MFDMEWPEVTERMNVNSSLWLRVRYASGKSQFWSVAQIVPDKGLVRLRFHPWTIDLMDEGGVSRLKEKIRHEREYHSQVGPGEPYNTPSVDLMLTPDEWNVHKEEITEVVRAMYTNYEPGEGIFCHYA